MKKIDTDLQKKIDIYYNQCSMLLRDALARLNHLDTLVKSKQNPAMTTDVPLEEMQMLVANFMAISALRSVMKKQSIKKSNSLKK